MNGTDLIGYMVLPIKPEELTRTEPSRISAVNTLDGAWVDSFGRGLTSLVISGNTGWGSGGRPDGIERFTTLRDSFVHKWHQLRSEAIANSTDPGLVRLVVIDPLNGDYVADVVPMQFVLKRSKSNPLLLLYNLSMTVTNDKATKPIFFDSDIADDGSFDRLEAKRLAKLTTTSIASMDVSVGFLQGIQGKLGSLTQTISGFGNDLLKLTKETFLPAITMAQDIIKTANAAKATITAAQYAVVNVAKELSATATTMWTAAAAVATIPAYAKSELMQIKGAFSNLSCVLSNGFADAMLAASPGGGDLYGASNCSSTAGGSPASVTTVAGTNPFAGLVDAAPAITKSQDAAVAILDVKRLDITADIDPVALSGYAYRLQSGVTIHA